MSRLIVVSFLLLSSTVAVAQPTNPEPAGNKGGVPTNVFKEFDRVFEILATRINRVTLGGQLLDFGDGDTAYGVLTLDGALIHYGELQNKRKIWPGYNAGRSVGAQWVPFSVSLSQNGNYSIKAALRGWRHMNAFNQDKNVPSGESGTPSAKGPEYNVINDITFLEFEVDRNWEGVQTNRFVPASLEMRWSVLNNKTSWFGPTIRGAGVVDFSRYLSSALQGGDSLTEKYYGGTQATYGAEVYLGLQGVIQLSETSRLAGLRLSARGELGGNKSTGTTERPDGQNEDGSERRSNESFRRALDERRAQVDLSYGFKVNRQPVRVGLFYQGIANRVQSVEITPEPKLFLKPISNRHTFGVSIQY